MLWQRSRSVFHLHLGTQEKIFHYFSLVNMKSNIAVSVVIAEETLHERDDF